MGATTIQIPSAIDEVVAKIQARVAIFLLCREKLTKLAKNSDYTIADNAGLMLPEQTKLESDLSAILAEVNTIQSTGNWSFSDITNIGTFYYSLERHISGTDDLWKKAGETSTASTTNWTLWAGIGIIILLLLRKRR